MESYDIQNEIDSILEESINRTGKPDYWSDIDWNDLPVEARLLKVIIDRLDGEILPEFKRAFQGENWKRALFLYMSWRGKPWLPIKHLALDDSMIVSFDQSELDEYINAAREWVIEAEGLLSNTV